MHATLAACICGSMLIFTKAYAHAAGVQYIFGGQQANQLKRTDAAPGRRAVIATAQSYAAPDAPAHGRILADASLSSPARRSAERRYGDSAFSSYAQLIGASATVFRLDPALVAAVIEVESGFDNKAVSPRGARGLMQLMPRTATGLGVTDPEDPLQNVAAGTRYLAGLLTQFSGDIANSLAAYNAGPGAVDLWHGVPPYPETRSYVQRVLTRYAHYRNVVASGNLAARIPP